MTHLGPHANGRGVVGTVSEIIQGKNRIFKPFGLFKIKVPIICIDQQVSKGYIVITWLFFPRANYFS